MANRKKQLLKLMEGKGYRSFDKWQTLWMDKVDRTLIFDEFAALLHTGEIHALTDDGNMTKYANADKWAPQE